MATYHTILFSFELYSLYLRKTIPLTQKTLKTNYSPNTNVCTVKCHMYRTIYLYLFVQCSHQRVIYVPSAGQSRSDYSFERNICREINMNQLPLSASARTIAYVLNYECTRRPACGGNLYQHIDYVAYRISAVRLGLGTVSKRKQVLIEKGGFCQFFIRTFENNHPVQIRTINDTPKAAQTSR